MSAQPVAASAASPEKFSFEELRSRVDSYMEGHGLSKLGKGRMMTKAVFFIALWTATYLGLLFLGPQSLPLALLLIVGLMVMTLGVEMGVMHDASHRAIFSGVWLNKAVAMTLTLIGGSSIIWYQQHVIAHHTFTNMPGKDPDIDSGGIFRFRDGDGWKPMHRWQHWYAVPLYMMIALRWIWIDDFRHAINNKYNLPRKKIRLVMGELVISRLSHIALFLVIPYMIVGSAWAVLGFYLIHWMLFGASMAIIFQLAHVTDVQAFPESRSKSGDDWVLHQLATTANFAVKNTLLTHLIGGLNFQVEHHIFNRFSSLHYPKIQPIVKKYCQDRGVNYFEYPSVMSAVRAHFGHLRRLGLKPGTDLNQAATTA